MEPSDQESKAPPRVTAVVVSYNNVEALRLCLTALERSKDREKLEIIVIDKGSRDGSAVIDAEFPGVTALRLPRNFGNAKAFNIGMRTAAADYIFFLEPETEVQPDTVTQLADRLDADPDAVAVCPVLDADQFYRLPTPSTGADYEFVSVDKSESGPIPVEAATFAAMMARKYYIRGINFLDEKYGETFADADLCFQIRKSGKKILAFPELPAHYTPRPERFPESALRLLESDRVAGASRAFGKYYGFFSSLFFRIRTVLGALFSFRFGLFSAYLSGRKVDGTQTEL